MLHRPPEASGLTERRRPELLVDGPRFCDRSHLELPEGGLETRRSEERSVPEWPRVVFEAKADEEALWRHATSCWQFHEQSGQAATTDLWKA